MFLLKEISVLLRKEIILEWRQRYAINGILLYAISTVFICYMSFQLKTTQLNPIVWNVLFWIIMLFTAVSAIAKSFLQESEGRYVYYYTLVSAEAVIVSKMLYNTLLMCLMSAVCYFFYALVMGNPVANQMLFLLNMFLGSIGFSCTLTMIAAIAAKADNRTTLMAVLSFPVILPLLLLLLKVSKNAIDGLAWSVSYDEIVLILAINVIVMTVGYLLFSYLWRS
jgi:heme exporter protein B